MLVAQRVTSIGAFGTGRAIGGLSGTHPTDLDNRNSRRIITLVTSLKHAVVTQLAE